PDAARKKSGLVRVAWKTPRRADHFIARKRGLVNMKFLFWVVLFYPAFAQEVSIVAPGGMRCSLDRMAPDFERKTGHKVKITIGAGGATHQQVVRGETFDDP